MKKVIRVCIQDTNRFFALGIQHILLSHFQLQGLGVCFVSEKESVGADLVFCSVPTKGWPLQLCLHSESEKTVFIAIRATKSEKVTKCFRERGSLWRRAHPGALLTLVKEGMNVQENPVASECCPCCMSQALTKREREVMHCMSWELTPKTLQQYLNISPKTVSAHKRAVMRKLGFRRNSELYHWLRLGGLNQIMRLYP
ncbi:response regulator transcription factor [Serratia ureilytica]|uniref:response regulator transcription factor n=1 Tax=Serratia ureilytica TaxID=300181 RepID=UPI001C11C563|nr:helix-turn-helix transcriptional regulator [Serratia ureilytica]MBU5412420.1 helix-turn-helix transcriptional regulator [Serratia ureilytica]